MTMTEEAIIRFDTQFEDRFSIRNINSMLDALMEKYSDDIDIINIETGEVISIEELHRVKGILDFFNTPYPISCQVVSNPDKHKLY